LVYSNTKLHYLSAGDGIFAIYVDNTMKSDSLYYIHKDYLGSMETITDENGMILEKLSFDPWGRRRNPTNWSYNTSGLAASHFDRGYTMHEHHDIFGLINMNGRLYNPWVGRMLSPDPYIVDAINSQNYNRYSYALNNPLKYVDPTGYRPHWYGYKGHGGSGDATAINSSLDRQMGSHGMNYNTEYRPESYSYNNHTGQYQDAYGNNMYFSEVHSNFVESNAIISVNDKGAKELFERFQNGELKSINDIEKGFTYYTVDAVPTPFNSSFANEVNIHFVRRKHINFESEVSGSAGGGLSWSQAKAHYQFGGGTPVNVDLSSIDLSRVSLSDFNSRGLATIRLDTKHFSSTNDALVHGTITLQLTGANTAKIALNSGRDFPQLKGQPAGMYNFEMQSWGSAVNWIRNPATFLGGLINGTFIIPGPTGPIPTYTGGTPFPIYYHGTVTIP
jgi:RHS repeat-associated protein